MEEKHLQMSESFFLTAILAIVGGFLDSYSYLMRGHVFANAQTGNIVLFGVNLQKRDFTQAFYYFVPILAFAVGVILVEIIKHFYKEEHKIHWRQRIVALEFVLITVVGFIPLGQYDVVANVLISFVCSMQVETFRRVHGHPFASTMCTGNLRSGTEALCQYFKTGDKTLKQKSLRYYGIITFFIIGAVIGGFLTGRAGGSSSDRNDLDGKRVQNLIKRLILQTFNNVCEISLFFFCVTLQGKLHLQVDSIPHTHEILKDQQNLRSFHDNTNSASSYPSY